MNLTQSLSYVRPARKATDNAKGFLYRHRWLTGAQDLVFPSHDAAQRWAGKSATYQGPRK